MLAAYAFRDSDEILRCPKCRRAAPTFARAVAFGSYDDRLRDLIHLLKFGGVRPAARILGRMLAQSFTLLEPEFAASDAPVAVIPVPLHKSKLRQRGFNQSELIARAALKLNSFHGRLQLAPRVLKRQRSTVSQIGLTHHQRRENLRGAFTVIDPEQIAGRDVLLIDDVLTTGTTASECARVLRRGGARQVWVATAARTLKIASKYLEIHASETTDAENGAEYQANISGSS